MITKPELLCVLIPVALIISACNANKPVFTGPLPAAPANWQAQSLVTSPDQPQAWIDDLHSPVLKQLVNEALAGNLQLRAADERWQAARAQSAIAGAPLLPDIEAEAGASRSRINSRTGDNLSLTANVSWEADVWGRLSNTARAALADERAFAADFRAARLSLAAEVARNWFASIEAALQEQLAQQTAETFQQSLIVIEERYRRGLNSALDVRLARSDVASAENQITRRAREKDAFLRRLDTLLGHYPAAELATGDQLPAILAEVPAGLPADLLIRRPDLFAAEQRLNAAGERLEAARKNRLPAIRLTASGGLSSTALNQLLDWDSLVFSLLAGIVQPVFKGGRLDAEQTLAKARHGEAWANYAQAILQAFNEVETALAAEDRYTRQLQQLIIASDEAQQAAELALSRYQNGLVDIITLLQSQRQAFTSQTELIRTRRERLDNRIALYLALGGDFSSEDAVNSRSVPGDQPIP